MRFLNFLGAFALFCPILVWSVDPDVSREEILRTKRTIVYERQDKENWIDMNAQVRAYNEGQYNVLKNPGKYFSVYNCDDTQKLICTFSFEQYKEDERLFEGVIAVEKSYHRQGYGTEISIALIDYMKDHYNPCVIVEDRDPDEHDNQETILEGRLFKVGSRLGYDTYWCGSSDLRGLSYVESLQKLNISENHVFHPQMKQLTLY